MNTMPTDCPREPELLSALKAGRPFEDELAAHAATCDGCRDLLEVASAVLHDRDALLADRALPGSGLVWWRLQMRIREEEARVARRTLLLVQVLCVSVAAAASLGVLHALLPGWPSLLARALPATFRDAAPVFLVLAAWLAVTGAPLAAYLATRRD
jgi:hypothetical protein